MKTQNKLKSLVLEVELNHGLADGFAATLEGRQSAGVEAVVALVTLQQVGSGDVRSGGVDLRANQPCDDEIGEGHEDSDNRQETNGKVGTGHGFKSRHTHTNKERIRSLFLAN